MRHPLDTLRAGLRKDLSRYLRLDLAKSTTPSKTLHSLYRRARLQGGQRLLRYVQIERRA
ncbi:MAG: hypothetical protein AAGF74_05620 [Pseudomonadota bacterium]